uniref:PIN domain-containing protein n=1 Tax=Anopheles farauti TaxID=69004 RepID=A0A182QJJ3_9DIPT
MEYSSNDVKQLFRSVYTLVKGQDELKGHLTVEDILQPSFQVSHRLLVSQCIQLMFEDFECVGQKSREYLWRKGYYDVISMLKRQNIRVSNGTPTQQLQLRETADRLIREGINHFKAIVLRFAQIFNLDTLRYLVDFRLLEDYDVEALREESTCYSLLQLQPDDGTVTKELYTKREISYALETIHSLLISLGDLHRYQLDFGIGSRVAVREQTRRFYLEAFKLNPKVGMAQNQLGMLMGGQNGHLDAVYHYLYSLCCAMPFECSEKNVNVIFQKNIRQLESGGGDVSARIVDGEDQLVDEFIATFLLVVDVFFYDKVVTDFTTLCHSVLVEFRKVLSLRLLLDDYYLTDDMIFKIVSILFMCMYRIKRINSDTIHSLNAFLVALCAELIQWCTASFEKFANEHSQDDARFQDHYLRRYQRYDEQVNRARNLMRSGLYAKDQKSSSGVEEGTGSQDSRGLYSKENEQEGKRAPLPTSGRKENRAACMDSRQKKYSRRRRRAYSNETDSEDEEQEESGRYVEDEDDDDDDGSEDDYYDGSQSDTCSSSEEGEEEDEDYARSLSSFGSYEYSDDEEDHQNGGRIEKTKDREHEEAEDVRTKDDLQEEESPPISSIPVEQLKFKKRYQKLDPNIVLKFAQGERTLRSLKLLLDWLLCNMDVLHRCFQSNPEFLHSIMKLLNSFNIDIFTNRFYFTRDLITVPGLREDLLEIFNVRRTIPLQEDVAMKRFPLFEATQEGLQWETPYKLAVSREDESFLRLMKLVDFGFTVCKSKKFDYCFLPKVRAFKVRAGAGGSTFGSGRAAKGPAGGFQWKQQKQRKRDATGGKMGSSGSGKRDWNLGGDAGSSRSRGHSYNQSRTARGEGKSRGRNGPGDDELIVSRDIKRQRNRQRNNSKILQNGGAGDDMGTNDDSAPALFTKKGYLHNRTRGTTLLQGGANGEDMYHPEGQNSGDAQQQQERGDINALMGQLWLRNEVETLESKVKKRSVSVTLTPYVVVDSKCLAEYTAIVKNLIKASKFVVLIPIAVLSDLDELKKHSEGARNAIKWLEIKFKKGNRFLRAQKPHEMLPVPLVKIPKKLDRDGAVFNQIVQFCNYIVTNHGDSDNADIITYLSGDCLQDRKLGNGSSYVGILEAIPVKFEQIVTFYSSYKRK